MRTHSALAVLAIVLGLPLCAFPQDEGPQDRETPLETPVTLRAALKSSVLLSRPPESDSLLGGGATGFWRLRLEPTFKPDDAITFDGAFEQRLYVSSSSALTTAAFALPAVTAPFRIGQLDWHLAGNARSEWRGEIDRAAMHVRAGRTDLTIGRQAIGWGRGAMFGAVDLFAPFSPVEVDREWRRGVDAARADVRLSDRMSLDSVAAFGENVRESAFVSRLRGYGEHADVEILGGYRARDLFSGVTSSAPVGDVELHGELAVFRTAPSPGSFAFSDRRTIVKGVAGGSYRVPLANGLLIYLEYHYSGFGAASSSDVLSTIRDPEFQRRYLRGDTQLVGRHALAALASYEWSPELMTSSQWIHSPNDGSGVFVPAMTWTLSDRWSVVASGYVPYGTGAMISREFGSSMLAAFLQMRTYW